MGLLVATTNTSPFFFDRQKVTWGEIPLRGAEGQLPPRGGMPTIPRVEIHELVGGNVVHPHRLVGFARIPTLTHLLPTAAKCPNCTEVKKPNFILGCPKLTKKSAPHEENF